MLIKSSKSYKPSKQFTKHTIQTVLLEKNEYVYNEINCDTDNATVNNQPVKLITDLNHVQVSAAAITHLMVYLDVFYFCLYKG